ncbi:NADH-FMN oxidoreductase RutF, flavin reductase (DIM6/NTAB) family [Marinospirillum celere]|uniref:NADH-FMN oxidoreductase RutF, flavin reductase (DIM6/NTAB) family n=1 Tax=Marinospirillum celere TaxID=1122252 RepID=A0A1I1JPG2_9GAMM|nr:flavin reductase family protein [Marinospirillum celere]SFC49842.1 NADH-FMN oxidoreductase RutF, flavin reductase (DIM6/NTAB) family [Marinospirillum celere]
MQIDLQPLTATTRYHLMTQSILPRPIAWVLTRNLPADSGEPSYNLAPFSYFNAVCSDPPLVMLSMGHKGPEEPKDTRRNLIQGGDFVIHLPSVEQAKDVTASAATLAYGDSELEHLDAGELVEFPGCPLPRLKAAPIAFHARFYDVHYLGPGKQAVIYAELLQVHVDDQAITEDKAKGRYLIDAQKINPLARLGGAQYASLGEFFAVKRPD